MVLALDDDSWMLEIASEESDVPLKVPKLSHTALRDSSSESIGCDLRKPAADAPQPFDIHTAASIPKISSSFPFHDFSNGDDELLDGLINSP